MCIFVHNPCPLHPQPLQTTDEFCYYSIAFPSTSWNHTVFCFWSLSFSFMSLRVIHIVVYEYSPFCCSAVLCHMDVPRVVYPFTN